MKHLFTFLLPLFVSGGCIGQVQGIDKTLQEQLEAIYVKDQTLRQLCHDAEQKFGQNSEEIRYFWSLITAEDRKNERAAEEIIKKRGWVGKSVVGGKANTTLWLVIQHAPLAIQEKYLPMLRASVKRGESNGGHLALLEDRILVRNGKPQIYGSQVSTDENGKCRVGKIQAPAYVNQRRKAIGLEPIEDYLKRWNIEWNVKQKTK